MRSENNEEGGRGVRGKKERDLKKKKQLKKTKKKRLNFHLQGNRLK